MSPAQLIITPIKFTTPPVNQICDLSAAEDFLVSIERDDVRELMQTGSIDNLSEHLSTLLRAYPQLYKNVVLAESAIRGDEQVFEDMVAFADHLAAHLNARSEAGDQVRGGPVDRLLGELSRVPALEHELHMDI